MAATESTMLELGTPAPDFSLPATDGTVVTRDKAMGDSGLLVMFICNHCPFVKHIADELATVGRFCAELGIGCVAISSNDAVNYPDDSPDKMRDEVAHRGYTFPYLYDESQDVAKDYTAACTPDFFLFDADGKLAYRGQLDDSRPNNGVPVTGADLRAAIEAVANGDKPDPNQKPSIGCNIKWKKGAAPAYA